MHTEETATITSWLQQCGLPRIEGRMLVQHLLSVTHSYLIAHGSHKLSLPEQQWLNQQAARRKAGEPLAYLLGYREFYGRCFKVSEAVLIPRPETEHLVEAAISHLPQGGCIWDLGTGSGAIAVTIACERPDAQVWATDISAEALAIARDNAANLKTSIQFGQGSWFQAQPQPAKNSVDVIIANPPYIAANDEHLLQGDLRFEPQHALTDHHNGLTALETIIAGAPAYLHNNGWLLLEHGYDQGRAVRDRLTQHSFENIQTLVDLAGLERVTLGQIKHLCRSPTNKQ